jgi:hypothetical protein
MEAPPTPNPHRTPPRVLIWLQDPVEADLLALQLRQAGLVVVAARGAEHVRNALQWAPADVFVVEIPKARATETLAFLKTQQSQATALYAVSGAGGLERSTELGLLALGCRDVWALPLSAVAIAQQVWNSPAGGPPSPPPGLDPLGIPGDFRFQPFTYVMQICRRHRLHARLHARLGEGGADDWGVLLLRHGEVIDAEIPGMRGKAAAVQWLSRAQRLFVLHPLTDAAQELTRPDVVREDIARLLMRARQQSGEIPTLRTVVPAIATPSASVDQAEATPDAEDARATLPGVGAEERPASGGRVTTADYPKPAPAQRSPNAITGQRPRPIVGTSKIGTATDDGETRGSVRPSSGNEDAAAVADTDAARDGSARRPSVPHIKRVRDDDITLAPEDTADGHPRSALLGVRRSTAPLGSGATAGGGAESEPARSDNDEANPGPTWYPVETEIAPVATESNPRPGESRTLAPASFDDAVRRGAPAVPPPRASSEKSSPTIETEGEPDRPHVVVNPKSGLIHISSVKLKPEGPPPAEDDAASQGVRVRGMGRFDAAAKDHGGLSKVRVPAMPATDESSDELAIGARGKGHGWLMWAGWVALAISIGFILVLLATRPDMPAADQVPAPVPIVQEAREKAAADQWPAVVELLDGPHKKGALRSPELKLLALAYHQTGDDASAAIVLRDLLKLSPDDAGATTWLAVWALAAGDVAGWQRLIGRADFLAPNDPSVRKLRELGP